VQKKEVGICGFLVHYFKDVQLKDLDEILNVRLGFSLGRRIAGEEK